jgi:hypothetical protein
MLKRLVEKDGPVQPGAGMKDLKKEGRENEGREIEGASMGETAGVMTAVVKGKVSLRITRGCFGNGVYEV